jgi:ribosomal protein S18 acetylase RimI-like enzyme
VGTDALDAGPVSIAPLDDAGFAQALGFVQPVIADGQTYALPRNMGPGDIRLFFFSPERQAFAARIGDGPVVGVYYLKPNQQGGGAHVANAGFMVDPAARGRGVARTMATHALETARAQGFEAMQFNCVVSTNAVAVALWHKMGFATIGTIPRGFAHPTRGKVDALIMHRFL